MESLVYGLGSQLFDVGQAYVVLSTAKSKDGILIEEFDYSKLTGKIV